MALDLNFTCISGDLSATINVARSSTKVAPEGMVFTVDVTGFDAQAPADADAYNPLHHDLIYYWEFGDAGSTFSAPVNAMTHQKAANTMLGPVAAHIYETPGTYTVSVLITEPSSGKTAYAALTLDAVVDPDTIYAGDKTYYMDTTDTGTGKPTDALVYDNIADAITHSKARGGHARFLFKDGQTWDIGSSIDVRGDGSTPWSSIHFAGEGGGTPAIIRTTSGLNEDSLFVIRQFFQDNGVDLTFHNLDFEGAWDETTETPLGNVGELFDMTTSIPQYVWFHKCRMDGFNSTVNTEQDSTYTTDAFGVSDCDIGTFLNTGMFINTFCPTAIIGNKMARSPDALGGGAKFDHNAHGAIRSQHTGPCVWAKNDLFNNAGWVSNVFGYATQQAPIRILQSGYPGAVQNVSQNTLEGGYQVLALSRQDNAFTINPQNIIVDGNILIGGFMTESIIRAEYGGITVRNNLGIRPNVPTVRFIFDPIAMVQAVDPDNAGYGSSTAQQIADNFAAPIKVYNNTYVMLTEDSNFFGSVVAADVLLADGLFTATTEANNVIHAPNADTALTASAPLDTTSIFTPRMLGYRGAYEVVDHTLPGTVADGASFTVSYPAGRSASDYDAETALDTHAVLTVEETTYTTGDSDVSFTFGGSDITVTNNSGVTWTAGDIKLRLFCQSSPPDRDAQYATPVASVATYAPLSGSAAIAGATTGLTAHRDFYGETRPATPSKGAFELGGG